MNLLRHFAFQKGISALLVVLLLVSGTGWSFNVHYCGGSVASVSLKPDFSIKAEKGCCGEKIQKDSCCKNKVVHFQKKSENNLVKSFTFQQGLAVPVVNWQPIYFGEIPSFSFEKNTSYYCDAHAPPLFKLYSQYLFYDSI